MTLLRRVGYRVAGWLGFHADSIGPDILLQRRRGVTAQMRTQVFEQVMFRRYLRHLFEGCRLDLVLDVGAHSGDFYRFVRSCGYQGRVASFEPVRELAAGLAAAARGETGWDTYPMALGDRDGKAEINVLTGTALSSFHEPNAYARSRFGRSAEVVRRELVERRRFDSVADSIAGLDPDSRIFLKLDTQGGDLEAFRGLGSWRDRVVLLQSEVSLLAIYDGMPQMPEVIDEYRQHGFEVAALIPVARDWRTMQLIELDCLMVRADAVAPR